jgi:predicted ferric reductase
VAFLLFTPLAVVLREPADLLYQLSRIGAILGTVLFAISVVLGIRWRWLESQIGEVKLVQWHHAAGMTAFLLLLFHGAYSWISFGSGVFQSTGMVLGIVALVVFIMMIGSIWIYKAGAIPFEGWSILHAMNYLIFPLAYIHSFLVGSGVPTNPILKIEWIFIGLLFFLTLLYRIRRSIRVRRHPYAVTGITQETPDVWSLNLRGDPFPFLPGQYLYLQRMNEGRVSPGHPFTIASSPTQSGITLSVKVVGDFTRDIVKLKPNDRVLVDGPYGRFSYLNDSKPRQALIFVAGGIGITPFLSMLRYLHDRSGDERKIWLIWGNKTQKDLAFLDDFNTLRQTLPGLEVIHVLSEERAPGFETGFIDADKIREIVGEIDGKAIFICGPPTMMEKISKGLRRMNIPKENIHWEKFTF